MEIDVTPDVVEKQCNGGVSEREPGPPSKNNANNSAKKIINHALRQQAKRRKKNTTIAHPRIIVKPLPPQEETAFSVVVPKTPTMKEVLASIPGFSIKPRKRTNKKLSTAAQLEQTKEGCIDLETPDSILVNTNLRALLNKYTFASLPSLYQQKLIQLLPVVDRQSSMSSTESVRLNASSLNNEFFARACVEWQERLSEGEFTPENQQKLKTEADKERSKLDPWKLKHFEPIWGDRTQTEPIEKPKIPPARPPIKIKLRNSTLIKQKPPPVVKRLRTVGAMTRSLTNYKDELLQQQETTKTNFPIPDLLPIKTHKPPQKPELVITPITKEPETSPEIGEDPLEIHNENVESVLDTQDATIPGVTIINISETLINKDEETIISCKETSQTNVIKAEKRRRSHSFDPDEKSPKRRSLTPLDEHEEKGVIQLDEMMIDSKDLAEPDLSIQKLDKDETMDENEIIETDRSETNDSETIDRVSSVTNQSEMSDITSEADKLSEIVEDQLNEINEKVLDTEKLMEQSISSDYKLEVEVEKSDNLGYQKQAISSPNNYQSNSLYNNTSNYQDLGIDFQLSNINIQKSSQETYQSTNSNYQNTAIVDFQTTISNYHASNTNYQLTSNECFQSEQNNFHKTNFNQKDDELETKVSEFVQKSDPRSASPKLDLDETSTQSSNSEMTTLIIETTTSSVITEQESPISNQIPTQIQNHQTQVSSQIQNQVSSQIQNQVSSQIQNQATSQIQNQATSQIQGQVSSQISSQIQPEISSQIQTEITIQANQKLEDQQPQEILINQQEQQSQEIQIMNNQLLPNSLILQQESIILQKECQTYSSSSPDSEVPATASGNCLQVTAEKLEASVEASDLVLSQFESNFETVRSMSDEDTAIEDRFIDAENYVLESGQISISTGSQDGTEKENEGIQTSLFTVAREDDCCWDVVDSSTEKLLEVPIHALGSIPVGLVGTENPTEHVEVIPMKEELEVRLQEGNFPVPNDWQYLKLDTEMVTNTLESNENETNSSETNQSYQPYSGNQVKLELEVTLTPEIVSSDSLVTSTVSGTTSSGGSNSTVTPAISKTVTTVIPPTTIVCLPSAVTTSPVVNPPPNSVTQNASLPRQGMAQSSSAVPYLALSTTSQPIRAVPTHSTKTAKSKTTNNNRNRSNTKPPPGAVNLERSYQICQAVIQNSPNRDQLRCQLKPPPSLLAAAAANNASKKSNNNENNRTQYGNVSSTKAGSKTFTPPLPATNGGYQMIQGGNGVKMKRGGGGGVQFQQRQPSPPVVVRHVFTSGQGIPVTMAVLPPTQALSPEVVEGSNQMNHHVGQYILVQRAATATGGGDPHGGVPRSSSAPPLQHQVGTINAGRPSQLVSVGAAASSRIGRPASADMETHKILNNSNLNNTINSNNNIVPGPSSDNFVQCPNAGTQAVTRRPRFQPQSGGVYGVDGVDNSIPNYTIIGAAEGGVLVDHPGAQMQPQMSQQSQQIVVQQKRQMGTMGMVNAAPLMSGGVGDSSCGCSLKAMVVCKKCGAFCHDDCIGPNKLCRVCFIR
ncbi:polycomb group protein Asx isoform X1 [Onthophagus taurus]|uniref:polycomb group protein Asx isoform X1 n=1 Tax=Onthophagus taurus TaxID=166361 RepID=UPI0039BDE67E